MVRRGRNPSVDMSGISDIIRIGAGWARSTGIGMAAPKSKQAEADVFQALAHVERRNLLIELRGGAKSASELSVGRPLARSSISEHLQALRLAGLVVVERRGRERVYHLDPRRLTEVGAWLNTMLAYWTRRLADLDSLAERERRG
jgi:DNA-binding transcriptional ArsR family regulator